MERDEFTTPPGSPRLFLTAAARAAPDAPRIERQSRPRLGQAVYDIYLALRENLPGNAAALQNALLRFPVASLRGFLQIAGMTEDDERDLADLVLGDLLEYDIPGEHGDAAVGFWLQRCTDDVQFDFYARNVNFVRGFDEDETRRGLQYDRETELLTYLSNHVEIYAGLADMDMEDGSIYTHPDVLMFGRDCPVSLYPDSETDSSSHEDTGLVGLVRATPDPSSSDEEANSDSGRQRQRQRR